MTHGLTGRTAAGCWLLLLVGAWACAESVRLQTKLVAMQVGGSGSMVCTGIPQVAVSERAPLRVLRLAWLLLLLVGVWACAESVRLPKLVAMQVGGSGSMVCTLRVLRLVHLII